MRSAWAAVLLLACACREKEAPAVPWVGAPPRGLDASLTRTATRAPLAMLSVVTTPPGATVRRAGLVLGQTPLVVPVAPPHPESLSLELSYPGLGVRVFRVAAGPGGHYTLRADLNDAPQEARAPDAAAPPDPPDSGGPRPPEPPKLTAQELMEQRQRREQEAAEAQRQAACQDALAGCQRTAGSCLERPKVETVMTTVRVGGSTQQIPTKHAQWSAKLEHEVPCQVCWDRYERCAGIAE